MSLRSQAPADDPEALMPLAPVPALMVWAAAAVIAALALIGLVMGLRQAPVGGGSAFGVTIGESPAAASASAAPAKPLTGDKWSTLSGPQVTAEPPQTSQPKTESSAPPSGQARAARSAAAAEAPEEAAPPPVEAAPPEPEPSQSPAPANNGQPDSMQNYY